MLHLARLLLVPLAALACRQGRDAPPPRANFLLAAGDSTFWVRSDGHALHVRGSPIQLARFGNRFYEVYVVDDDRSYTDASIVGQQIFRRDLISSDSAQVFRDTTIASLARWYADAHPEDRPLEDDEDPDDDPRVDASSDISIVDQHGPFLSYEYRADATIRGKDEWHVARRGVIDLRSGTTATVASLFGQRNAEYLLHKGEALFKQTLDSVLASKDSRARAAAGAISDVHFDSSSFVLVQDNGEPALQFAATGHGKKAGGLLLELAPIRVQAPGWWTDVRSTMPAPDSDATVDRWPHAGFDVVASYAQGEDAAHLTLVDHTGRKWSVTTMPSPARRIFWLEPPGTDSATVRALARAFDDAALYSDEVRTAMLDRQ